MRLYLIERTGDTGYDEQTACVVAASSPASARVVAGQSHVDEPYTEWTDPERSSCTCIGTARAGTAAGLILSQTRDG